MTTIADALVQAHQAGLPRLDAQLLLLHALDRSAQGRAWLISHDQDLLTPSQKSAFDSFIEQRSLGVPVAYLVGQREFFGLLLEVTPDVLDPRPDTETLVEWALEYIADMQAPRILDLGTGSGAIALAIQAQRRDASVYAIERSERALAVAKRNAKRHALPVQWLHGSWFSPLDAIAPVPFDLIVSNPPYIREDDPHLENLQFEPQEALTSGASGLTDIAHIIGAAPGHLRSGGRLLLEHGWDQHAPIAELLQQHGYTSVDCRRDLAGHIRCTGGQYFDEVSRS